jgi:uncharacterized cupin superfamily protein
MIIRRGTVAKDPAPLPAERGTTEKISDAGGITQYGVYVVTLEPGAKSANRHWHSAEDETMFVIAGECTVIENDGAHVLVAGDAACWPAGIANAHHVLNQSSAPCSYLIVGTRVTHDVCKYPDLARTLYTEGDTWRLVNDVDGAVIKSGPT